jgi:DNA-binding response OmpR family regulator
MTSPPRVLVVDDDPSILRLAQFNLEADGFEVEVASDGLAGLKAFQAGRFDCLVLDLMMPGLDGFELLEAVRGCAGGESIPAYLLTARATAEDRDRAESLGVTDYLRKPFDPSDLSAVLLRGLGRE